MKATPFLAALIIGTAAAGAEPAVTLEAKAHRDRFLPTETRCLLQVQVDGKEETKKRTAPINLAVVLDRSGSMRGEKIQQAREAALVAFDQLSGSDTFSLVIYDQEVEVVIPPTRVRDAEHVRSAIHRIESRGSTALYEGVQTGAEQVERYFAEKNINRVLLLSDGIANIGLSSPTDLARLGSRLERSGISVSTVGLGLDYNEDLMTALAEAADGNYYYVRDAEELPDVFASELGEIKTLVARGVRLIIELPEGIQGARVLGDEEYRFSDGRLEIELDDFFGGRTRRFLIECDLPKQAAAEVMLPRTELVYVDAATGKTAQATAQPTITRSDDAATVEKSTSLDVSANLAVLKNRLAKEEALDLMQSGKADEAVDVIRAQQKFNLGLAPAVARKAGVEREQQTLESTAAELERSKSISGGTTKKLKYENYQDKYQKR